MNQRLLLYLKCVMRPLRLTDINSRVMSHMRYIKLVNAFGSTSHKFDVGLFRLFRRKLNDVFVIGS